jgi:two-component system sensor histidine kinase RegB
MSGFSSLSIAFRHAPLQRLLLLRWLSLACMLVTAFALSPLLGIAVPAAALAAVMCALIAANLFSLAWLASRRADAHGSRVLFLQLLIDVAAWAAFLYFTGGATNPLISILLPLVAIGATILPARAAWLLAVIAVMAYSLLWQFHRTLPIHDDALAMRWHLAGMWITFALSAAVIVGFLVRLNAALRERDAALADADAAMARDAHIVALGNLAAGAAHDLGTPLGTMRIVIDDLLQSPAASDTAWRDDVALLGQQVDACRWALTRITAESGNLRAEGGRPAPLSGWLQDTVARWREQRPGIAVRVQCAADVAGETVIADATLAQALHTLVNNAADAQSGTDGAAIEVTAARHGESLVIGVGDRGSGMDTALLANAGIAPVPTSRKGMGIGLFLARRAVERCGGTLGFTSREGGGTLVQITLPLARIAMRPAD